MGDTTVIKVQSMRSPHGPEGQIYLAGGKNIAMRMWKDESPQSDKPTVTRDYETVGYVLTGRAELTSEGQTVLLEPGDSWVVPKGAAHSYRILESFTAIEATYPPAEIHDRDRAR